MSVASAEDLDELLLRLIGDTAMLRAYIQEADANQFEAVAVKLKIFFELVGQVPQQPTAPGNNGLGFRASPSRIMSP